MSHNLFTTRLGAAFPAIAVMAVLANAGFSADWPQFLGPTMNNVAATSSVVLARTFPDGGPPVVWSVKTVGDGGVATPVVRDGRIYVSERLRIKIPKPIDPHLPRNWLTYATNHLVEDIVRCLDLRTGAEYWRYTHQANRAETLFSPYSSPAVDEQYVFVTDDIGWVYCLDKNTGKELWKWQLAEQYGAWTWNNFGYSSSPTLYKDLVVLPVMGATASVIALNKATGIPRWTTPPLPIDIKNAGLNMKYAGTVGSTPLLAHFGGVDQFVISALRNSIFSVEATTGRILWREDKCRVWPTTNPILLDSWQLVVSGDFYGGKCCRIAVEESASGFATTLTEFDNFEEQTMPPLLVQDNLFIGSAICAQKKHLRCVNAETGKIAWETNTSGNVGCLILTPDGLVYGIGAKLLIFKPNADHFEELYGGTLKNGVSDGGGTAIVDGNLLEQTRTSLTCYDISEPAHTPHATVTIPTKPKPVIGQTATELCNRLNAPLLEERTIVMDALAQLSGTAASVLIQATRSGDWLTASSACAVLKRLGPAAKTAAPDLATVAQTAVKDKNWALAEVTLDALVAMDAAAIESISPAIMAALKDTDKTVQRHALQLIEHMGCMAGTVADAVIALHNGQDNAQTRSSIIALGDMASAADKVVPVLACDLSKTGPQEPDLQFLAMAALRKMGVSAKDAISTLQNNVMPGDMQDQVKLRADTIQQLKPASENNK